MQSKGALCLLLGPSSGVVRHSGLGVTPAGWYKTWSLDEGE